MAERPKPIRALGEVVLRVRNLDAMQEFYSAIIGLELLRRFNDSAFLKIAPGYAGHTQVLALFKESIPPNHSTIRRTGWDPQRSTLHHIAFAISLSDYTAEKERLEKLGLAVETREHSWMHWRSLYVSDPEGNAVELVCYDASVS
ncbi:MAG: VOC family protein [bacterium]